MFTLVVCIVVVAVSVGVSLFTVLRLSFGDETQVATTLRQLRLVPARELRRPRRRPPVPATVAMAVPVAVPPAPTAARPAGSRVVTYEPVRATGWRRLRSGLALVLTVAVVGTALALGVAVAVAVVAAALRGALGSG